MNPQRNLPLRVILFWCILGEIMSIKLKPYHFLILISLAFSLFSCESVHNESSETFNYDPLTEIPAITFDSISSTVVTEYEDSLVFTISYIDGNGDLGSHDPDATVIELVDNRDSVNLVFPYHLSPRAPEGAEVAIQGTLDIVLGNTILLNDGFPSETTTFSLRIVDEAGNWSNKVTSPEVVIEAQ